MKEINVLVFAGVRPQYIKLSALNDGIAKFSSSKFHFRPIYIDLGQHYDANLAGKQISASNLRFDFTIKQSDKRPMAILGNIISSLENIITHIPLKPDWAIVFGDANCSLAAGIAAAKSNIKVAHIEAGIRVADTQEGLNSKLIDHLSSLYFASSQKCIDNLAHEGITQKVYDVGDIYYDVIKNLEEQIDSNVPSFSTKKGYVLVTLHHDIQFNLIESLINFLLDYKFDTVFIYHPKYLHKIANLELENNPKIKILPPLVHSEMLGAIKASAFVITDSGGIQREAYFLKKHCLLVQKSAFWPELADGVIHKLVGLELENILGGLEWAENILEIPYPPIRGFGDGNAIQKILNCLSTI
jgi:UDP-GlcNAc3NAcA epimerase